MILWRRIYHFAAHSAASTRTPGPTSTGNFEFGHFKGFKEAPKHRRCGSPTVHLHCACRRPCGKHIKPYQALTAAQLLTSTVEDDPMENRSPDTRLWLPVPMGEASILPKVAGIAPEADGAGN